MFGSEHHIYAAHEWPVTLKKTPESTVAASEKCLSPFLSSVFFPPMLFFIQTAIRELPWHQ